MLQSFQKTVEFGLCNLQITGEQASTDQEIASELPVTLRKLIEERVAHPWNCSALMKLHSCERQYLNEYSVLKKKSDQGRRE